MTENITDPFDPIAYILPFINDDVICKPLIIV